MEHRHLSPSTEPPRPQSSSSPILQASEPDCVVPAPHSQPPNKRARHPGGKNADPISCSAPRSSRPLSSLRHSNPPSAEVTEHAALPTPASASPRRSSNKPQRSLDQWFSHPLARDQGRDERVPGPQDRKQASTASQVRASSSAPRGAGGWANALTRYATLHSPRPGLLPDGRICLLVDHWTMAVVDAFPKAKYHVLVLPRIPFPLTKGTSLNRVTLDSLATLLPSPAAGEVLGRMRTTALKVKQIIESHMPLATRDDAPTEPMELLRTSEALEQGTWYPSVPPARAGKTWPIAMGFHSVPSMKTLHLHVISTDWVSPLLKRPQHYLSFHPRIGFCLPLDRALEYIQQGRTSLPLPPAEYETLTRASSHGGYPLIEGTEVLPTLPKVKAYLLQRWLAYLDMPKEGGE